MGKKKQARQSAFSEWIEKLRDDSALPPDADGDRTRRLIMSAGTVLLCVAIGIFSMEQHLDRAITSTLLVTLLPLVYFVTELVTGRRKAAQVGLGIAAVPVAVLLVFDPTGGVDNLMWSLVIQSGLIPVCGLWVGGLSSAAVLAFVACAFYSPLNVFLPSAYISIRGVFPLLLLFAAAASCLFSIAVRRRLVRLHAHELKLEEERKKQNEIAGELNRRVIRSIVSAVDAKDNMTRDHSVRVAKYASMLAERLGWDLEHVEIVYQGGMLHDIGKIGVDDSILKKSAALTNEEYAQIKKHTVIGKAILDDVNWMPKAALCAESHHERYDGTGYPYGLKGEEIPIEARIVAIADSFDAMNANRIYRKHLTKEAILRELESGAGRQFDPELLKEFMPIARQILNDTESQERGQNQ